LFIIFLIIQQHRLVAMQIAFDLEDNATQEFLNKVMGALPAPTAVAVQSDAMDTGESAPLLSAEKVDPVFEKLLKILSGEVSIALKLEFLHRNNQTDLLILTGSKKALESRSTVYHSAVTFANAFMNAGTTR
jgi:26S proteasome regulatory subunit N2